MARYGGIDINNYSRRYVEEVCPFFFYRIQTYY